MEGEPNPLPPLIIALGVTMGLFITAAVLFAAGIFKQIGMMPTVAVLVADTIVAVVIWVMYGFGKLGGPKR